MKCKICNEDIYKEIDFRTLFRRRYSVHYSCLEKLKKTVESITFPIQNHLVEYHFIYTVETTTNSEIVEQISFGYVLENSNWSIDFWGSIEDFLKLDTYSQYLFWQLQKTEVVFGSLIKRM